MNILIVTVYNHDNCGSFLQAYALGNVLERQGHSVSYLESPLIGKDYSRLYSVVRQLYKRDFRAIPYYLARHSGFRNAHKLLHVYDPSADKSPDVVVIGSDTLWNQSPSIEKWRRYIMDCLSQSQK